MKPPAGPRRGARTSPPAETAPPHERSESAPRQASPPVPIYHRTLLLGAGSVLVLIVAGIAASEAARALSEPCTDTSPFVPSCGGLLASAVFAAVVTGVALALGLLCLRRADILAHRRLPAAAGLFLGFVLVAAVIPFSLTTPPPSTVGIPPVLPFPIPIGTTFNATELEVSTYAEARVSLDPYAPWAPILLEGAFNATSDVCLRVTRGAGGDFGPGLYSVCGTGVTFAFEISSSTWDLFFYVPMANPQTVFSATVVIAQSVQIVY